MGFIGHVFTKIIAFFVGAILCLLGFACMFGSPILGIILLVVGALIIGTALRMMWVN